MTDLDTPASISGTFEIAGRSVHRLGFGAMRLTGQGIWGEPADRAECVRVVRRAVELGVDLIDTADSYGPHVSEEIIAEALHPYPEQVLVATKAGLTRHGPDVWAAVGRPGVPAPAVRDEPAPAAARPHRSVPAAPDRQEGAGGRPDRGSRRAARRGQDRRHRPVRGLDRAARRGPGDHRDRHRPEPLQPHRPQVRGRPRLLHPRGDRLHPVVPHRGRRPGQAGRPGGRDREAARGDRRPGGAGLAAGPRPGGAADPGYVQRRAPRGEPARPVRSTSG